MKLTFLGANRQVTGSRYFLEAAGARLLIDCGMFQERPFLDRNWECCPVLPGVGTPASIDALLLTHAHLDHVGLVPRLVDQGFKGPIYTTPASIELAMIVLNDAAKIQAEDAKHKEERHAEEGRTSPHNGATLYTPDSVTSAAKLFRPVNYNQPFQVHEGVSVRWLDAGHILGSAMLEVTVSENGTSQRIVFSGDVGMWDKPIIHDPTLLDQADYVIMESTYGDHDHDHPEGGVGEALAEVVNDTVQRGGNVLIPTFAIERAQELMFYFSQLVRAKKIPPLMVFLDSPMALDATAVFRHHPECMDAETNAMLQRGDGPFHFEGLRLIRTPDESKAINNIRGTCVIMAGSGMCTAGRIKHHLAHNIYRPESTVLFVGYQAQDTLGRQILDGEKRVRVLGEVQDVKAKITKIEGLSAHADRSALMRWLGNFKPPIKRVFLTHGEQQVALNLADHIRATLKYDVDVPHYKDTVDLI